MVVTAKHPVRVDYVYEGASTAAVFMAYEPLSGWLEAWCCNVTQVCRGQGRAQSYDQPYRNSTGSLPSTNAHKTSGD